MKVASCAERIHALDGAFGRQLNARRVEATRRLVSTLLASSMESLLLRSFNAWRDFKARFVESPPFCEIRRNAQERQREPIQKSGKMVWSRARCFFCGCQAPDETPQASHSAALMNSTSQESIEMAKLLKSEASYMLMARKEQARAEHGDNLEGAHLSQALRRWVSSFLASQIELLLLNTLRAWRSMTKI